MRNVMATSSPRLPPPPALAPGQPSLVHHQPGRGVRAEGLAQIPVAGLVARANGVHLAVDPAGSRGAEVADLDAHAGVGGAPSRRIRLSKRITTTAMPSSHFAKKCPSPKDVF